MNRTNLYCQVCLKSAQTGFNKPKSLHKTKRSVFPNLQKFDGELLCSRCRRTLKAKIPIQVKI